MEINVIGPLVFILAYFDFEWMLKLLDTNKLLYLFIRSLLI